MLSRGTKEGGQVRTGHCSCFSSQENVRVGLSFFNILLGGVVGFYMHFVGRVGEACVQGFCFSLGRIFWQGINDATKLYGCNRPRLDSGLPE